MEPILIGSYFYLCLHGEVQLKPSPTHAHVKDPLQLDINLPWLLSPISSLTTRVVSSCCPAPDVPTSFLILLSIRYMPPSSLFPLTIKMQYNFKNNN